ncbi:hypothetical protein M5W97_19620, partial [Paenibacillus alvei]|nr:hypothetical protein [Paenibacillus alvei]
QRYELAPMGSSAINGSITAASRIPNSMELWWLGGNRSIQGAYWYEGGQWQRYELAQRADLRSMGVYPYPVYQPSWNYG